MAQNGRRIRRNEIVGLIETHYSDFGPTLASEMLTERHNIEIHKEVLRRIMLEPVFGLKNESAQSIEPGDRQKSILAK